MLLTQLPDGLWQVEVNGFDYFDTAKGELVSGGKGKIAAWQLDTDYDGRGLFPRQVFFLMAGKDEGWVKSKKTCAPSWMRGFCSNSPAGCRCPLPPERTSRWR